MNPNARPNSNATRPYHCGTFKNFLGTSDLDLVAIPAARVPGIAEPTPALLSLLVADKDGCIGLSPREARRLASRLLLVAAELEAPVAPKAAA